MSSATATRKTIGYGFASWAIPFVVSLLFFERGGQPRLPLDLIKSIMVLVGAGSGGALLALLFREHRPSLFHGLAIGSLWLFMNVALDLAILVPMARMSLGQYFAEIGVRYIVIPIMAGAMAAVGRAS
jgi:uncharacterized membrane protein YpjA